MNDTKENSPEESNIWNYYQNEAPELFDGAKPRLNYLIKQINSLKRAENPKILNIGPGSGYFEQEAMDRKWGITCLDPDEETIDSMKSRGVDAICGVMESLPFESNTYDFVVASEVLEHLTDSQRTLAIKEVFRVLKAPGYFLGTVPYKENLSQNIVICPKCDEVFHRWGHKCSFDVGKLRADILSSFPEIDAKITAYLSFHDLSFYGLLSAVARYLLALVRMPISSTSIYFCGKKLLP